MKDKNAILKYKEQIHEMYSIETDELEWKSFSPGEYIYEQGFPLSYLSFLVKGKVKIYATSEEGKRLIVAFNNPLEIYGDLELVQQVDTLHTVEAVTEVHVAILPLKLAKKTAKKYQFQ